MNMVNLGEYMQVTASAPGKAILFGEHAVVYGKPAIAVAIDKRVHVKIQGRPDSQVHVQVPVLNISGYIDPEKGTINLDENLNKSHTDEGQTHNHRGNNTGILNYILESMRRVYLIGGDTLNDEIKNGIEITVDLGIPIGAGLGSSAAVTVAAIAALSHYYNLELKKDEIAANAHKIELEVQGAASPIDTTLSTFGGIVYLSENAENVVHLPLDWNLPLIIGYTEREGNTGQLISSVRGRQEKYPSIVDPILNSIQEITENAREALETKNEEMLGELMNINHGLLDALGVNTSKLSRMVYIARENGALGSKITGAGGGGSILVFAPYNAEKILSQLQKVENAFPIQLSGDGVEISWG